MNTNNVIDFITKQPYETDDTIIPEIEGEDLIRITYQNVDDAFEGFLYDMAQGYGYAEVMQKSENLEIAMGYVLTVLRSSFAMACDLQDGMTHHVMNIVEAVKLESDIEDVLAQCEKEREDDSC